MPINPSALSSPDPDESAMAPSKPGQQTRSPDPEPTPTDDRTGDAEVTAPEEQPQRRRRTRVELIAAAVVPADDAPTALKDAGTGAKIERPWAEAVALVKDQKAEFVDKSLKYAVMKAEQQAAAPAFQTSDGPASQEPMGAADTVDPSGQTPPPATDAFGRPSPEQLEAARLPTDASGQMIAPEGSEHGDEVVVGSKTYHVGPGGALVDGVVDAPAKRRWQRELGTGADGPWEAKAIVRPGGFSQPGPATQNGNGPKDVDVQTERLPRTQEVLDDGTIKIGTGILEKIGMPDYSSFQVGPITMSRTVIDDGRRTAVTLGDGRPGEVITAAVEGFDLLDNTVEFIGARFRGQLVSFLQATGAIKQPVS